MKNNIKLYLIPPYGNIVGRFNPNLFKKYHPTEDPARAPRDVRSVTAARLIEEGK